MSYGRSSGKCNGYLRKLVLHIYALTIFNYNYLVYLHPNETHDNIFKKNKCQINDILGNRRSLENMYIPNTYVVRDLINFNMHL